MRCQLRYREEIPKCYGCARCVEGTILEAKLAGTAFEEGYDEEISSYSVSKDGVSTEIEINFKDGDILELEVDNYGRDASECTFCPYGYVEILEFKIDGEDVEY